MLEQQPVSDIRLSARHGNHAIETEVEDAAFDFRHGTPGADEELVAVGLGLFASDFGDSGTTWFSSARVPSISMNTSLLLVVMVTFVTGWTSPSQLTLTAPPEGAKKIPPKNLQASHGVGGPAAVGVLDFDGHTEQFRQAFVGQAILQRTGVDDGASTGITH